MSELTPGPALGAEIPPAMAELYERLAVLGWSPKAVREKILPDWWDDEVAESGAGFAEAATYIGRYLKLDVRSLLTPGAPLKALDT